MTDQTPLRPKSISDAYCLDWYCQSLILTVVIMWSSDIILEHVKLSSIWNESRLFPLSAITFQSRCDHNNFVIIWPPILYSRRTVTLWKNLCCSESVRFVQWAGHSGFGDPTSGVYYKWVRGEDHGHPREGRDPWMGRFYFDSNARVFTGMGQLQYCGVSCPPCLSKMKSCHSILC